MAKQKKPAGVPTHLSVESKKLWRYILKEFELEEHHLATLRLALEALDRATNARKVIDKKGPTYFDRFDQPKERPEVKIEHNSRNDFRILMRELGLDEFDADDFRPPRSRGRNR